MPLIHLEDLRHLFYSFIKTVPLESYENGKMDLCRDRGRGLAVQKPQDYIIKISVQTT